jgi:hypothetical protein
MGLDPPDLGDREPPLRRFRGFLAEDLAAHLDRSPVSSAAEVL